MAAARPTGSDSKMMETKDEVRVDPPEGGIKMEMEVNVKTEGECEPGACVVCGARGGEAAADGAVQAVLARHGAAVGGGALCRACLELVDVLERAEREYERLKRVFEAVLARNPAHAPRAPRVAAPPPDVKTEDARAHTAPDTDSEDEPLAHTKKRRITRLIKGKKKKPKPKLDAKHRLYNEESWECDECGTRGVSGGPLALATHKLTEHTIANLTAIKTEDCERSQSPFDEGIENGLGDDPYLDFDDEDDSTYVPEDRSYVKSRSTNKEKTNTVKIKKMKPKEWYPCDQCNARYSSKTRLEQHKQKHDGSKPPYICEVCGAHYKHKRACDIHIQLHKGISDWKCEECNKLFPSKSALQRHNNIHTGKLNYQCDLCGKSFIHTSSFKMHKLSHSGVKPHACDVCGLALMTRSHLKRHKRIHSGEKRHECGVCGKRFSERYNLAAHGKSHEAEAAGAAPPPQRRLFRCAFCPERFERRYMLERHVSASHGRTLERPPATPRNTMSKLLKAQALARRDPPAPAGSPPAAPGPRAPAKLLATTSSLLAGGSWSGAYAAEFGIRTDFPH